MQKKQSLQLWKNGIKITEECDTNALNITDFFKLLQYTIWSIRAHLSSTHKLHSSELWLDSSAYPKEKVNQYGEWYDL
jgi:hypothetical protein